MSVGSTDVPRVRRRALWRGEAGLPDRPVLVEWFPLSQLPLERSAAQRTREVCHAQILRLLSLGTADARSGYAISEACDGVDLATVARAAPGELPPWWSLQVIVQLGRALLFLVDTQQRRKLPCLGHGRISASTVYIGWNGSVQLLAFAASSGSQRSEETQAPELRGSERLLTPTADVYALAVLLRQLLPASVLARPTLGRLLRRALHSQADQRVALPVFLGSLSALLWDLQAPLSRAQALGEILGRFCPRASVDLLETDWGESTGDGLAALPPSLAPLSAVPVALSPTWYPRLAPSSTAAPSRTRRQALLGLGTALGLGAAGLVGLGVFSRPDRLPPMTARMPSSPQVEAPVQPHPTTLPPSAASPIVPQPALTVAQDPDAAFSGLRIALGPALHVPNAAGLAWTWVHMTNPGRTMQTVDLHQLRLHTPSGTILRPLTRADLAIASRVEVGPGRRVSRRLAFGPNVSDTAEPPPATAGAKSQQRTPNASTTR